MADDRPKGRLTKLRVTGCTSGYSGVNKRGDEYTIWEISATRPDGTVIDQKLRSFEEFPVGDEIIEVTVTPFVSELHGTSYTISRKGRGGSGNTQRINDLQDRMARVEKWIAQQGKVAPAAQSPDQAVAGMSDLDERFGAEAPY